MRTLALVSCLVTSLLLHSVPAAAANLPVGRLVGRNELSLQTGVQVALGGTTPGGARLLLDYARHIGSIVWLDFKVDHTFPLGWTGLCTDPRGRVRACDVGLPNAGHALEVLAGVKLKLPFRRPVVAPYFNLNAGLVGIFARPLGDNGVAVVVRPGAGIRWYPTPHLGIGGEVNVALGGAFYQETCPGCRDGHNEFYRAIDFNLGLEFVF